MNEVTQLAPNVCAMRYTAKPDTSFSISTCSPSMEPQRNCWRLPVDLVESWTQLGTTSPNGNACSGIYKIRKGGSQTFPQIGDVVVDDGAILGRVVGLDYDVKNDMMMVYEERVGSMAILPKFRSETEQAVQETPCLSRIVCPAVTCQNYRTNVDCRRKDRVLNCIRSWSQQANSIEACLSEKDCEEVYANLEAYHLATDTKVELLPQTKAILLTVVARQMPKTLEQWKDLKANAIVEVLQEQKDKAIETRSKRRCSVVRRK